jgi:hypothetical protein
VKKRGWSCLPGSAPAIGAQDRVCDRGSGLRIGVRDRGSRAFRVGCGQFIVRTGHECPAADSANRRQAVSRAPGCSYVIETVRASRESQYQHVGAGACTTTASAMALSRNDLPAPSARIAEIVMFRPVCQTPPWLLPRSAAHCVVPAARTAHLNNAVLLPISSIPYIKGNLVNTDLPKIVDISGS